MLPDIESILKMIKTYVGYVLKQVEDDGHQKMIREAADNLANIILGKEVVEEKKEFETSDKKFFATYKVESYAGGLLSIGSGKNYDSVTLSFSTDISLLNWLKDFDCNKNEILRIVRGEEIDFKTNIILTEKENI